ncbi:uncharacterized protein LOC141749696 isoform X1 [Larus michahellis]|uniref:uncharacterized protein LOC141749696 isoform X1 n=1 Tax=Larus michahellis TaxID=119627 RepID=UPI003D9BD3CB
MGNSDVEDNRRRSWAEEPKERVCTVGPRCSCMEDTCEGVLKVVPSLWIYRPCLNGWRMHLVVAAWEILKSAPGSGHWRSWGLVRPAGVTGSSRSWNQLPTCSRSGGSPGLWIETSDSSQWVLGDAPVAAWTIFNSVCRSGAGPSARSCQRSHVLERMQIFVPGLGGFPLWTFILSWLHGALRARGWSVKRGNSPCMARVSGDAASAPLLPSPASSATLEQIPRSLCISVPSRPPPGESQLPYLGVELRASVVDSHVTAELGCARGSSLWESA